MSLRPAAPGRTIGWAMALLAASGCAPSVAADFPDLRPGRLRDGALYETPGRYREPQRLLDQDPPSEPLPPRFFPREEGDSNPPRDRIVRIRPVTCVRRRVPVPTSAADDPSYVGSAYGLGKPSYYGFTPALGIDDPYGRPVLPYCP